MYNNSALKVNCTTSNCLLNTHRLVLNTVFSRSYRLNLVPVHHMQAHATVIRMLHADVEYPFVCLLISGGHALLTVAHAPDKFQIVGKNLDKAPGECLDKIARDLHIESSMHPGAAMEELARR